MSSIQAITSRVKSEGLAIRNMEMHKTGRNKESKKDHLLRYLDLLKMGLAGEPTC